MKKKTDYRSRSLDKIAATAEKKQKDPTSAKKTAKQDLRVKGG